VHSPSVHTPPLGYLIRTKAKFKTGQCWRDSAPAGLFIISLQRQRIQVKLFYLPLGLIRGEARLADKKNKMLFFDKKMTNTG